MSLHSLLRPSSIAVVGASPRSFIGQIALANCATRGFRGNVVPVTVRHVEVAGRAAVQRLSQLTEIPDVALVQVAADRVLQVVAEGLAAGVRGFIVPGAGFTDSGDVALQVSAGLRALRERYDYDVVGPNCMGVLDLVTGAAPYVGTVSEEVQRGSIGLIAQSGAIVEAFVNAGGRVPLSTAVSSGSEAITCLADYLTFFVTDPHTTAVLAFVETVAKPERTLAAARALSEAGKPLAVCVVGRSAAAQDGVAAHSGKLASGARVTTAAFHQAGAIIADDLDELIAIGELCATERRPRGKRLHVVTNSGGEGNLIADIAEEVGLELPPIASATESAIREQWPRLHVRNPLDPWGAADYSEIYPQTIQAAADEPGDIVVVAIDQQRSCGEHERQLGLDLARYLRDATYLSTKLAVMLSPTSQDPDPALADYCHSVSIPLLRGARPALSAIARLAQRDPTVVSEARDDVPQASVVLDRWAGGTEDQALEIVSKVGIRIPRYLRVASAAEAVAAAEGFDGPVVLKGVAEGLLHKTELGLVKVGLSSPRQVLAAAEEMLQRSRVAGLNVDLLVVEMVRGELEVIVGYKRDPIFGPTVLVGLGGVWTETLNDVAVHVGPVGATSAGRLLSRTRAGRMIADARGGALCADDVIAAIRAVSDLGIANPDIVGIDINPLIVGRDHAIAVDAVIERA